MRIRAWGPFGSFLIGFDNIERPDNNKPWYNRGPFDMLRAGGPLNRRMNGGIVAV